MNAGLTPPETIEPDGKLHRFASNGKRDDDSGWYVLHDVGVPTGAFGDWRTGLNQMWRAELGRELSAAEQAAHRERVAAIRKQREAEDVRRKAGARERAWEIWKAATPAPDDHPYLIREAVKAHELRIHDGALVVPMRDGAELHSLQFIGADGGKRFLAGGRVKGCYFPIGKPDGVLCLAEGFATAANIYESTGHAVAATFCAGNLLSVAKTLRAKFPELRLIVCSDDDMATPGNPGLTKAREAAGAIGGWLAVPDFGAERPEGASDFNDLARVRGAGAVRASPASPGHSAPAASAIASLILRAP